MILVVCQGEVLFAWKD